MDNSKKLAEAHIALERILVQFEGLEYKELTTAEKAVIRIAERAISIIEDKQ